VILYRPRSRKTSARRTAHKKPYKHRACRIARAYWMQPPARQIFLRSYRERTLNNTAMKQPGPDHPITIEPSATRVVVTVAGRTIVDTRRALILREAKYPPMLYVPRSDADMSMLERSELTTYCPYKGECSYFSVPTGGEKSKNAVWTYEAAYPAVKQITGHLAFYPQRVDSIIESSD